MTGGLISPDPRERFLAFVKEREDIRVARAAGVQPPWTKDPILAEYRFCNVRREDDRVTRWIAANWRVPHAEDPDLFFAMAVARFVNLPETLAELGYPVPWNRVRFLQVMKERKRLGKKVYSGAYMIRSDAAYRGKPKPLYQADELFDPLWKRRKEARPQPGETLNSWHAQLGIFHGMGSFMAAQLVADMKYVEPLKSASDWWTFAASGPGSRRGLNFVLDREMKSPWREDEWRLELTRLQNWLNTRLMWSEPLHGQDTQNALCELHKWEKARQGLGQLRARFTSHA